MCYSSKNKDLTGVLQVQYHKGLVLDTGLAVIVIRSIEQNKKVIGLIQVAVHGQ